MVAICSDFCSRVTGGMVAGDVASSVARLSAVG
jgi:hypothetical protein